MTELKCPCCGAPMGPVLAPTQIPMSPVRLAIVKALPATVEQLARLIYGVSTAMPEKEHATIRAVIYQTRKILRPYGWTIDNAKTGGWGAKTYQLVRLP